MSYAETLILTDKLFWAFLVGGGVLIMFLDFRRSQP